MSPLKIYNLPQISPKFLHHFLCHFPKPTRFLSITTLQTSHCPKNPSKTHVRREKMSANDVSHAAGDGRFDQNVIVMRHGDRMDNFVPTWVKTAKRPWDPPLFDSGKVRAFNVGNELRTQLGFPIHHIFVSPFLRCIQTASEVINAICSEGGSDGSLSFDPYKVKVSIEYGLCEMLNRIAIRPEYAPKDGDFRFNISELEALLPAGIIDHTVERIYQEMPLWEETVLGSRSRYEHVIQVLADKNPRENLLLITHGEGVGTSVSTFNRHVTVYEVNYCAYSHARRRITFGESGSFSAESFQLLTVPHVTGIGYSPTNNLADGV